LQNAVLISAGFAWFMAMYVAPLTSLLRSPFPRRINLLVGLAYFALILVLAWVNAQAVLIESVNLDRPAMFKLVFRELVQPLRW
jgi:uncharacterized membrane protein YGL010W